MKLLQLVDRLPDHSQAWVTNQQKSQLSSGFEILGTIPLPNAKAQIEVTLADSTPHVLVLGELLGLFIPQLQPFTPGFDPENGLTSELTAPEITQPVFYIYDHLGNTRATYHVDITCPSTKVYVLEYASEYYPYGKTLRDYTLGAVKEKYETTQHERDQETGLDYRGARFYDSDVARFLSVDPLAVKYPGWSTYNYVLGNPIRFIDPDGRTVIGSDGKPVEYIKNEDGKIEWSQNATPDIIEVGNAMLTTDFGEKAFNLWQSAKTEVFIRIDLETLPKDNNYASTYGTFRKNDDGQNIRADVVIYKKQIDIDRQAGADSRFENSSFTEVLGAVGTHEVYHNDAKQIKLDKKVKKELRQNPEENKPINAEVNFRREYHSKNPGLPNENSWNERYKARNYKGL